MASRIRLQTTDSDAHVIHESEIVAVDVPTAYEAIVRLRPQFLWRHGAGRAERPGGDFATVYLDGRHQGSLDLLRTIPSGMVREIRFLSPNRAASLYGGSHPGGVIDIWSRR